MLKKNKYIDQRFLLDYLCWKYELESSTIKKRKNPFIAFV